MKNSLKEGIVSCYLRNESGAALSIGCAVWGVSLGLGLMSGMLLALIGEVFAPMMGMSALSDFLNVYWYIFIGCISWYPHMRKVSSSVAGEWATEWAKTKRGMKAIEKELSE